MPSRFEINADKQAAANARQRYETAKALHEAKNYRTKDEKAEAERVALYWHHKVSGSLGAYYMQYPMDPGARQFYAEIARYQFPEDQNARDRER